MTEVSEDDTSESPHYILSDNSVSAKLASEESGGMSLRNRRNPFNSQGTSEKSTLMADGAVDPIRWFGALTPPSLKAAQGEFRGGENFPLR